MKALFPYALLGGLLLAPLAPAAAADPVEVRDQEPIYGYELMTPAERTEHRAKMRRLKTKEARERFRMEHHKKMQARAKARGVTLPDEPMPRERGMGSGGMGGGMGGGGRR